MDGNAMTTAPKVVNGINVDDLFSLLKASGKILRKASPVGMSPRRGRARRRAAAKSRALASAAKR